MSRGEHGRLICSLGPAGRTKLQRPRRGLASREPAESWGISPTASRAAQALGPGRQNDSNSATARTPLSSLTANQRKPPPASCCKFEATKLSKTRLQQGFFVLSPAPSLFPRPLIFSLWLPHGLGLHTLAAASQPRLRRAHGERLSLCR